MAQDIPHAHSFSWIKSQHQPDDPAILVEGQFQHLQLPIDFLAIAHDAIIICDPQQHIRIVNRSAEMLYGWSEQEIIGQDVHTLLQSTIADQNMSPIEITNTPRYWEGELHQIRRDGAPVIVNSRQSQLHDATGQPIATVMVNQDITAQKELEKTVRDQADAARIAQETGLWTWDLIDNQGHRFQKGINHTHNRSDSMAIAYEKFLQTVHPADRKYVQKTIEHALNSKRSEYMCEYRVIWPDQSIHWIWSHGHVLYDHQNHPKTIVGISLDITERHHYEEILQTQNRRINAIIENIADGFFILDEHWHFIYLNTQAEQIMRRTRESLLGKNIWKEIPAFLNTPIEEKARLAVEQRQNIHFETFHNLTKQWLDIQIHPTREEVSVYCKDITEYKLTEMALRGSERKFMQLVDSNVIGVAYSDREGEIFEANEAFLSTLGYTQQDLTQQHLNWQKLTPPDYHGLCEQATEQYLKTGSARPYEKELYSKNGECIPLLMAAALIDRETQTSITLSVDMRPYKEIEKQKEMFMSIMGHELRTPLTAINGSIQLAQRRIQRFLQQHQNLSPDVMTMLNKQDHLLEQSLRQTRVQNRLINDLLDISRLAVDKLELSVQPCDLVHIVQETVEDLCYAEVDHQINLQLPERETVIVKADSERVGQVIANYVTNALKYSPPGTPITVGMDVDEEQVYVWVRDQGPGLSEEAQKHIWDRYYRVNKDQKGKGVNLGLGLYICLALIQRHHGEVGVKSQEGKGSCFWFSLPITYTRRLSEDENIIKELTK